MSHLSDKMVLAMSVLMLGLALTIFTNIILESLTYVNWIVITIETGTVINLLRKKASPEILSCGEFISRLCSRTFFGISGFVAHNRGYKNLCDIESLVREETRCRRIQENDAHWARMDDLADDYRNLRVELESQFGESVRQEANRRGKTARQTIQDHLETIGNLQGKIRRLQNGRHLTTALANRRMFTRAAAQPTANLDTAKTTSTTCANCGSLNLEKTDLERQLADLGRQLDQRDSDLQLARDSIVAEQSSREEAVRLAREKGKVAALESLRGEFNSAVEAEVATRAQAIVEANRTSLEAEALAWKSRMESDYNTKVDRLASSKVNSQMPGLIAQARADLEADFERRLGEATQKIKAAAQNDKDMVNQLRKEACLQDIVFKTVRDERDDLKTMQADAKTSKDSAVDKVELLKQDVERLEARVAELEEENSYLQDQLAPGSNAEEEEEDEDEEDEEDEDGDDNSSNDDDDNNASGNAGGTGGTDDATDHGGVGKGNDGGSEDAVMTKPTSLRLTQKNPLFAEKLDIDSIADIIKSWYSQHPGVIEQWIERDGRKADEVASMEKDYRRTISWLKWAGIESGDYALEKADLGESLIFLLGYIDSPDLVNVEGPDVVELSKLHEQLQDLENARLTRVKRKRNSSKQDRKVTSS
ncbi:MAG: hypothetical protein MMC33_008732 [Icmadophila ericetorum]|nr:hypothetical protein [Icmadophila ericetorum]